MRNELITKEPELYFDSLHQELDNFLRDTFFPHAFAHPLNIIKNTILKPAIEVAQDKDNYNIKVQLPGVKKEDIDIELENDYITICAQINEVKETDEDKEKHYHTSEFRYGKYQRTISFNQPIKKEEIEAHYKDGILSIRIPIENTSTKEKKKIEIKDE